MSNVENLNVNNILAEAQAEFDKERREKAIKLLKAKLKEKENAKLVLANIQRELDDLVEQVKQGDVE